MFLWVHVGNCLGLIISAYRLLYGRVRSLALSAWRCAVWGVIITYGLQVYNIVHFNGAWYCMAFQTYPCHWCCNAMWWRKFSAIAPSCLKTAYLWSIGVTGTMYALVYRCWGRLCNGEDTYPNSTQLLILGYESPGFPSKGVKKKIKLGATLISLRNSIYERNLCW